MNGRNDAGPSARFASARYDRNMGLQPVCPAAFQAAASLAIPKQPKWLFAAQAKCLCSCEHAGVAELADALDSKSSGRKAVWVRAPPPAGVLFDVGRSMFGVYRREWFRCRQLNPGINA